MPSSRATDYRSIDSRVCVCIQHSSFHPLTIHLVRLSNTSKFTMVHPMSMYSSLSIFAQFLLIDFASATAAPNEDNSIDGTDTAEECCTIPSTDIPAGIKTAWCATQSTTCTTLCVDPLLNICIKVRAVSCLKRLTVPNIRT